MAAELTTIRDHVPSISATLQSLADMRKEVAQAETIVAVVGIKRRAEVLKALLKDVKEVRQAADLTVLDCDARIGEELLKIDKGNKHQPRQFAMDGSLIRGRGATGIPDFTRARVIRLAGSPLPNEFGPLPGCTRKEKARPP